MQHPIDKVMEYMETLSLRREEKEEVENVILGYMTDLEARDKRIDELEHKIKELEADPYETPNR